MGNINRIYESDGNFATAGHGQIVSRSLFAVVERGDMPLDGGFGEAEFIEIESPATTEAKDGETPSMRVRIDTVPQDTIAISPDSAAAAAAVMHGLSNDSRGQLGFRVEYLAD